MSSAEFLTELRAQGIELRVEDGRLLCSAPRDVLTPEIQGELKQRKAELVAFLSRARLDESFSFPPIPCRDPSVERMLSFAQTRLWFIDQLDPGGNAYNLPAAWQLDGPIDLTSFSRAVSEICRRHELLRSRFGNELGRPVIQIDPPRPVAVPLVDLTDLPEADREERLHLAFQQEAAHHFDLRHDPPFRLKLYRTDETTHHVFFMPHHIVWDAWSFDIFLKELAALYGAFAQGLPSPLPELPIQYADYAAWEREMLESDALRREMDFWRDQLAGTRSALDLPTDRPRPAAMSYRGTSAARDVPQELIDGLSDLVKQEGATLYMGLLGLLTSLLARYSGQDEFSVGCPIENTMRPEIEDVIGFFVNTLVLRTPVDIQQSYRELLRQAKEVCLDAFSNQHVPFERLVDEIDPPRDRSRTPLTQVLLLYQDASTRPLRFGDLDVSQHVVPMGGCQTDLFFGFKSSATGWGLGVDYATDLFDAETVERMLDNMLVLMQSILREPDAPLESLEIMTDSERDTVLRAWNECTAHPLPADSRLDEQITRLADEDGAATAVVFEDRSLSRAELEERSNQLARHLREAGIGHEDLVGVCVERGLDMVVALLAVWKAGAAYVPLDPGYPADRIAYILEDAETSLVIALTSTQHLLPSGQRRVLVDADASSLAQIPGSPLERLGDTSSLAYVIYTSGSTGRPKGVMVEHRNLVNFMVGMRECVDLEERGVWLTATSISFDISVLEIFGSLACGFELVVYGDAAGSARHGKGFSIPELIAERGVTHFQCTPSQARMLLADVDAREAFAGLKQLLVGGEALPAPLAEELLGVVSGQVLNMYGPTETTIWSTVQPVEDVGQSIPIGSPIANTQVYVVDSQLRPAPIGVRGELLIGGAGVVRGYWRKPELTRERFVPDPFTTDEGARLYRTGDLARQRADGSLEFLGRNDFQVKLRGYRIELGEIEGAIDAHPDVKSSVVVVQETTSEDERLVGFYTRTEGGEILESELREQLRTQLPSYMVPAHLQRLDELPMTPNGKIDRGALPELEIGAAARTWSEPSHIEKLADPATWMQHPVWRPIQTTTEQPTGERWLIFADAGGYGEALRRRLLGLGIQVAVVRSGDAYFVHEDGSMTISPESGETEYEILFQHLRQADFRPDRIVHLWMITSGEAHRPGSSFAHRNHDHGFASLVHISRSLARIYPGCPINLDVVANGLFERNRGTLDPEKAMVLGPSQLIAHEIPDSSVTCLDVRVAEDPHSGRTLDGRKQVADAILELPRAKGECLALALGDDGLMKRDYDALEVTELESPVHDDGLYVITGAMSGVGLAIAETLSARAQLRLALLDDELPVPGSDVAQRVELLRSQVADLRIMRCDLRNESATRLALDEIMNTLGKPDGIVHCAGVSRAQALASSSIFDVEEGLSAVLMGTASLEALLESEGLDFLLLVGAPNTAAAPPGSLCPTASSAFLQAFAQRHAGGRTRVLAIDWGIWNDADGATPVQLGFSGELETATHTEREFDFLRLRGLTPREASEAALTALGSTDDSVVRISSIDVEAQRSRLAELSDIHQELHLAPRDDTERELVKIWGEVLGRPSVGVRDDFFDLGGHSLSAVRVFGEIQRRWNVEWPLATLFEASTIEAVADRIRTREEAEPPAHRYVVRLRPGSTSDAPPIFCVAGALGNLLNLRHLAQLVERERPFYGLQARGLLGSDEPHRRFEDAARDYLEEVRQIQPEGPYTLAGFCSGGLIAYEMAHQLLRQGESVASLVLLDTTVPHAIGTLSLSDRMVLHRRRLSERGASYLREWARGRAQWEAARMRSRFGQERDAEPAEFRSEAVWQATFEAMAHYRPQPFPQRVYLIRPPIDRAYEFADGRVVDSKRLVVRTDNGWRDYIDDLVIEDVRGPAGDHDGFVLEPVVHDLASVLMRVLAQQP